MEQKTNVCIIGAGVGGEYLLKEFNKQRYKKYNIVGFIDDDINKSNKVINKVPVLGTTEQIPSLVNKYNIDLFVIAIPSATGEVIQRITNIIRLTKVNFMIVPPIFRNLVINQIAYPREVDIDDLLRRPVVNVLTKESLQKLKDAIILISGVAGSIGSELCLQIASCSPKKIIGLDIAETPLFQINNDITNKFPNIKFEPILGSIQNRKKIKEVIEEHKPQIIYHCAAYKHVGLMENFPHECVSNNIYGSLNIIKEAITNKVNRFVFVSTDKAVNPTSIMGASKRIIEKYILSLASNSTKFMIVRFGNVLESNGSAIKIFKDQIQKGGPATITDLKMERYFMTITEAAQLVVQASILGKNGELMVLDMGEPYKIIEIIHRLIELYGFEIDSIPIKIIGKRKGEKLTEELFYEFENPRKSENERILYCNTNIIKDPEYFKNEVESFAINHLQMKKEEVIKNIFKLSNEII